MKTIIFDGKGYAQKKKILLETSIKRIKKLGIIPHLATLLIGSDPASILYTNLKKKFIESLGCLVDIYNLPENVKYEDVELLIKTLNEDKTVHGIMVQLPLPEAISNKVTSAAVKFKILNLIAKNKDVDGLRDDSDYLHPTSKAVLEILKIAENETKQEVKTICVKGANGMVGKPLVKELTKLRYILQGETLQADTVVSATGKMNLITPEMVKEGAIVIDVGSPFGDVCSEVKEKASFFTPVPGGVGPVTITCLAENLILAVDKVRP